MDKINNAATLIESVDRAKSYRESLSIQPVAKTAWIDDEAKPAGPNADIAAAIDAKANVPADGVLLNLNDD
jgi:hypothetical protein